MQFPRFPRLLARPATWVIVAAVVAAAVATVFWLRRPAPPAGEVRVGYRWQPPIYLAPPGKPPGGIAVDVLGTAAARLGVSVRWTRILGTSDPALLAGTIDIWPTSSQLLTAPGIKVTEPWLESTTFVISKPDALQDSDSLRGRRVAYGAFGVAQQVYGPALSGAAAIVKPQAEEALQSVCTGEADAAFVEGRELQAMLLTRPAGCDGVPLTFRPSPASVIPYGIGSTRAFEPVARMLRAEISRMSEDGTLAAIHSRWSLATANETRLVYTLQQERQRTRWSQYGIGAMTFALAISLWQIRRNRQARRLAEQASRTMEDYARQQERYRLLFERNLAGVVRSTVEGRILDCNRSFARMLGYESKDELLAVPASRFYLEPADRDAVVRRLREEGSIANYENHVRRKDGSSGWLLESVTMIAQGGDQPAIVESTVIDITELRRLEDQYRQAQKLESVGRLAGGVAHDFNNLLTAINGYTELVLADLPQDSPFHPALEEIRKAGQRAASLTQQLLAFSRKQMLRPVVFNVNEVIGEAGTLLKRVIGEDVELVTRLDPGLGNVRADQGQLHQVVMNLAVNARDAMPNGGRLTIETSHVDALAADADADQDAPTGPFVRVRISDTGLGMDDETRRRVFEPFFTTKEVGKGTGLGLSTVYGIVKQSGGHIVLTTAPGNGTCFDVYLPRVTETDASEGLAPGARPALVLVVEDQEEVRHMAAEALGRRGFRVLSAADARGAIDICRRETGIVQLLVVDVVARGVSGPALVDRLLVEYPLLKVLFVSASESPAVAGWPFLQKPFTPAQLVAKVSEVLGGDPQAAADSR